MPRSEPEITQEAMAEFLASIDNRIMRDRILDYVRDATVVATVEGDPSRLATIARMSAQLDAPTTNISYHLCALQRDGRVSRFTLGHNSVHWAINVKRPK